jgi:hypothetical protein
LSFTSFYHLALHLLERLIAFDPKRLAYYRHSKLNQNTLACTKWQEHVTCGMHRASRGPVPRGSNSLHNRLAMVVTGRCWLDKWVAVANEMQDKQKNKNGGLPERAPRPRWAWSAVARYPSTIGSRRYSLLCETSLTHYPSL